MDNAIIEAFSPAAGGMFERSLVPELVDAAEKSDLGAENNGHTARSGRRSRQRS
ncbi:hypothetical protein BQ8482_530005 [Mesorhizobium delmotii]|uniref:Uncharacterized protein n=1 Tax=Mesorhizobium delmotii TaxID=1631247 RepID=A0A2P9AUJ1_9HYPH|nr:hypothetical protein BQ8482_530005 [Mesorhizobium delmotii]